MSELRRDPILGRWVIITTEKEKGPADFKVEEHAWRGGVCPFCIGQEDKTPPEIDAYRQEGTEPDTPGWSVRVVPNKFPALQIGGDLNRLGIGMYDMMNGVGAHEVIIETTDHDRDIYGAAENTVEQVIRMHRSRSLDLSKDERLRYVLIFKNYGRAAGASLRHSHSQLIALPIVPKRIKEELYGTAAYYDYKERCLFCDIIRQELEEGERLVAENKSFLSFAPFVSCFPFETWIIPKEHRPRFDHIEDEEIGDLARILKENLTRMKNLLKDPPYNFIIHTSPIGGMERKDYHWRIEIMPRLTRVAGYEWGTGFYINPTPPEKASRYLRETKI